jgi:hypothetical protein
MSKYEMAFLPAHAESLTIRLNRLSQLAIEKNFQKKFFAIISQNKINRKRPVTSVTSLNPGNVGIALPISLLT